MTESLRLSVKPSFGDMLELNRAAREPRIKALVALLVAVALALAGVSGLWFRDQPAEATELFVWSGMFLLVGLATTSLAGIGGWLLNFSRLPVELEINPAGVAFLRGTERTVVNWKRIGRWFETQSLLVLVARGTGLPIPKRSCSAERLAQLRQLMERQLGSAAGW